MNVRIPDENLSGAVASQSNRIEETSPAKGSTVRSSGRAGEDRIEISSLSERIAAARSEQDAQQAARVQHLASLYASGRYHVDSLQVGRALLAHAVSAGKVQAE